MSDTSDAPAPVIGVGPSTDRDVPTWRRLFPIPAALDPAVVAWLDAEAARRAGADPDAHPARALRAALAAQALARLHWAGAAIARAADSGDPPDPRWLRVEAQAMRQLAAAESRPRRPAPPRDRRAGATATAPARAESHAPGHRVTPPSALREPAPPARQAAVGPPRPPRERSDPAAGAGPRVPGPTPEVTARLMRRLDDLLLRDPDMSTSRTRRHRRHHRDPATRAGP